MRTLRIVLLAVVGIALGVPLPPASAASGPPVARPNASVDWPQFRFDDRHTGANPFETTLNKNNVPSLGPAWQAQLGDLVNFSSPAVVGGVAYIGSSDGQLWAYRAGGCGQFLCTRPLWHSVNLWQILDSPTVANGMVYVGSQTSADSNDGKLDVFSAGGCDKPVCAPLWRGLAGTESILESSPAVASGVVYVATHAGRLFAFDATGCGRAKCKPLWTGQTGGSVESSPTVVGGVAYIGSDDGKLYAFDANGCGRANCRAMWTGSLGNGNSAFGSSPAVANGVVYIGSAHNLAAFDANGCGKATCQPLWQAPDQSNFYGGSPAVSGGRVYIGLESGLAVFSASGCGKPTCSRLWLDFGAGAQAAVESSPTVAGGVVFAGRNTGEVLAWKAGPCGASTCDAIWTGQTGDPIVSSSPTVVNGMVYVGGDDDQAPEDISGRLYVWALP